MKCVYFLDFRLRSAYLPQSPSLYPMKKKPHQTQSAIDKVFSDFRSRLHKPTSQPSDVQYEVKKHKKGFTVVIHRERGANQTLHFETRKEVDTFLKDKG